jgi:hypothetical protein
MLTLAGWTGRAPMVALNFAALAGAFVLFGLLAAEAFGDSPEGKRRARQALWWVVLFPSQGIWAGFVLRDSLHLLVLTHCCLFSIRLAKRKDKSDALGIAAGLFWLFTLRIYSALFLAGGWAFWAWVRLSPRRRALWGAGALALGSIAVFLPPVQNLLGPALTSFAALLPAEAAHPLGLARELARGLARLLFGPYGWVWIGRFSPDLLLYPGQWALYLGLLPAAVAVGARLAVDGKARREAIRHPLPIPLAVFFGATALVLILAYGGLAFRQWHPWTLGLCLLAPLGWEEIRRWPRAYGAWMLTLGALIALRAAARVG